MARTKGKKEETEKSILIRMPYKMWEELRQMAFDNQESMANIARNAIQKSLNKYYKRIDN